MFRGSALLRIPAFVDAGSHGAGWSAGSSLERVVKVNVLLYDIDCIALAG
jgi:hypothetical protein